MTSSGVCALSCSAFCGSDRFTTTVSIRQRQVFKRLKSILAMGHLPKYDDQSSRAWLYGKLLVALLTQRLVHLGSTISPWGGATISGKPRVCSP